jgi:hypothetical protein
MLRMWDPNAPFRSPLRVVLAACALLLMACGGGGSGPVVSVGDPGAEEDAAGARDVDDDGAQAARRCENVTVDGDVVLEMERDFTARFRVGEPYTRTVMLFGGEELEEDNVFSNAYIFALDQEDAVMLAEQYDDFYLCSSPGGEAASSYIIPYDLIPANCEVHDRIVRALQVYARNLASGGDRTSLRFEGAPLELESVTANGSDQDYTDQVSGQDFHLVTSVEQLTGESVINFATRP